MLNFNFFKNDQPVLKQEIKPLNEDLFDIKWFFKTLPAPAKEKLNRTLKIIEKRLTIAPPMV